MGIYFKVLACIDFEICLGVTIKDTFVKVYVEADNEDQAKDFARKYLDEKGYKNVRILQCEVELNPKLDEL